MKKRAKNVIFCKIVVYLRKFINIIVIYFIYYIKQKVIDMNIDTIGYNAGLVWNALNDAEAMGLKQVKKATKLKDKELYAAIGWLAREGKLLIAENEDEKDLILSLAQ